MNYETLLLNREAPLVTVTLNRPNKLNAMDRRMLDELTHLLAELRDDSAIRFVIFTGAGRAFSAGYDLRQPPGNQPGDEHARYHQSRVSQGVGIDMFRNLQNLEQVTIAAVNGYCMGGAALWAATCDFTIAAQDAVFGIPEARVGLYFTWGASARLNRAVGPMRAKEMIMTCENISAEQALSIGLVTKVVPAEKLMESAREMVAKIADKSPLAIRFTKKLINAASTVGQGDVYLLEPELFERLSMSGDIQEGSRAFAEKRPPRFRGV